MINHYKKIDKFEEIAEVFENAENERWCIGMERNGERYIHKTF